MSASNAARECVAVAEGIATDVAKVEQFTKANVNPADAPLWNDHFLNELQRFRTMSRQPAPSTKQTNTPATPTPANAS